MIKAKKIVGLGMLMATVLGTVGCSNIQQASGTVGNTKVLRVAFNQNEEHPEYKAIVDFGEKFKEATDGAYELKVYPNALLGDQGSVTELVRSGAIQMAIIPSSIIEAYDKNFAFIGAPYVYQDLNHLKEVLLTGVYNDLFKSTRSRGFEVVSAYTSGVRNIYADKPINTPQDLAGYKIRIIESDTYAEMLRLMGGVGTPMAQGEVYTAIQQKVIDGAENNEVVYSDFKHFEVSPYYSYTQHLILPDVVIANADILDGMSKEHREIFNKLLNESIEVEFGLWNDAAEKAIETAQANGVQIVYPDTELFRESCKPLLEKVINLSDVTKELYKNVEALRK